MGKCSINIRKQCSAFPILATTLTFLSSSLDPAQLSGNPKITREEFLKFEGESQILFTGVRTIKLFKGKLSDLLKACQAESVLSHGSLTELERKMSELPQAFHEQKRRIACVRVISKRYRDHYDDTLVRNIIREGSLEKLGARQGNAWIRIPFLSSGASGGDINIKDDVMQYCEALSDQEFLSNIERYIKDEPLVEPATRCALESAYSYLSSALTRTFGSFMPTVLKKQREVVKAQIAEQLDFSKQEALRRSAELFSQEINSASELNGSYVSLQ